VRRVFVHCFLDGRDTRHLGRKYVGAMQDKCREIGVGEIATVVGVLCVIRDKHWERTERAYKSW